ncbi:MAG: hypothetical protein JXN59_00020 [Anaerolineae bacterium]|nr:hypothetical protein [Anaerolineae bacterium]
MPFFRSKRLAWLLAVLALAAACSPLMPTPEPEPALVPKQLATVDVTATPVHTLVVPPTSTALPSPTRTPIPPTPTASPTAYVGIFMGDGSAPLVMDTPPAVLVEVTLLAPTPLGGIPTPSAATATPPGAFGLPVASGGTCIGEIAPQFEGAYNGDSGAREALGCPVGQPELLPMAEQAFERGTMFWTSGREIYALAREPFNGMPNMFWKLLDQWQEGMPESDPSMTGPDGTLQPVRGFGLAWRTSDQVRSALGWAVSPEAGYNGVLQRFERGVMIATQGGAAYALAASGGSSGQYIGPLF